MSQRKVRLRSIEFNASEHCNLRCSNCNHASPYSRREFASAESFERDAVLLSKFLHADRLRILGGEPLLHPDLLRFVAIARKTGLADRIGVVTNGVLLSRQSDEFWSELDFVDVAVYPETESRIDVDSLQRKAARHATRIIFGMKDVFRISLLDYPIENRPGLLRDIFKSCFMANYCPTLKGGYLYRCSVSPFLDTYLRVLGYRTDFSKKDGLLIEDRPDMPQVIAGYLASETALGACRFCLGSSGKLVRHRQLGRSEAGFPRRGKHYEDYLDRRQLDRSLMLSRLAGFAGCFPGPIQGVFAKPVEWLMARSYVPVSPLRTSSRGKVRPRKGLGR